MHGIYRAKIEGKEKRQALVESTWETPYVSVKDWIVTKKFPYRDEYYHADGIGRKLRYYHWPQRSFRNAVLDAFRMNENDMLLKRAIPYAVTDDLKCPYDEDAILSMIKYLAEECKERQIAIAGGETEIRDDLEHMEFSITMMGFIKNPRKNVFKEGDILVGLGSNGLHSNGFGLVKDAFGEEYRDEFIRPTRSYWDDVLYADGNFAINGMAHITGDAYKKLGELLDADILIRGDDLHPQPIFFELYERGVNDEEMYRTFNCGVGFVLSTDSQSADRIASIAKDAYVVGKVVPGSGKVRIKSAFSGKEVVL